MVWKLHETAIYARPWKSRPGKPGKEGRSGLARKMHITGQN